MKEIPNPPREEHSTKSRRFAEYILSGLKYTPLVLVLDRPPKSQKRPSVIEISPEVRNKLMQDDVEIFEEFYSIGPDEEAKTRYKLEISD